MGQRGEKKIRTLGKLQFFGIGVYFRTPLSLKHKLIIHISVVSSPFFTIVSVMQPHPPPLPAKKKNQNDKANKHILVFQRKIGLFNFQFYWTHH